MDAESASQHFSTNADPPALVGGLQAHKQFVRGPRPAACGHRQSPNHLRLQLATFGRYLCRPSGDFRRNHDIHSVSANMLSLVLSRLEMADAAA